VLSLNEREIVLLDGDVLEPAVVKYRAAINLFSMPDAKLNVIKAGNTIEIRGRFVSVFRNKEVVKVFECRCDEFGPQVPILLSWAD